MSMQHIEDGVLHAWLDDALDADVGMDGEAVARHLAECDQCRRRLEEARASKAAVSAMFLASDAPLPPPPSFQVLESAARSGGDAPVRPVGGRSKRRSGWTRGPRVRLAWAATIAVAVSAGVLARELSDRRGIDLPATLEYEREAVHAQPDEEAPRQAAERQKAESAELRQAPTEPARVDADELAGRERLEANPAPALIASAPRVAGCWRSATDSPGGVTAWFRLEAKPDPFVAEDSRTFESDAEAGVMSPSTASWRPLGADSIIVAFPGLEIRLRVEEDRLAGVYRGSMNRDAEDAAYSVSELSFERVPCPNR